MIYCLRNGIKVFSFALQQYKQLKAKNNCKRNMTFDFIETLDIQ